MDFGPYFNDWLRESAIRVARIEMRGDEAALVVMAEGDDNVRNSLETSACKTNEEHTAARSFFAGPPM